MAPAADRLAGHPHGGTDRYRIPDARTKSSGRTCCRAPKVGSPRRNRRSEIVRAYYIWPHITLCDRNKRSPSLLRPTWIAVPGDAAELLYTTRDHGYEEILPKRPGCRIVAPSARDPGGCSASLGFDELALNPRSLTIP
jgi:hypothetical protein